MKVCVGCVYEYDWTEPLTATPEGCKGCEMVDGRPSNYKQKPQTNADRIRAMSDEELAEQLHLFNELEERIHYCQNLPECDALLSTDDGIPDEKCIGCLLKWLKQPAEE